MATPTFTESEIEAAIAYRADSTFIHATKQGWDGFSFRTPAYLDFLDVCATHQNGLDGAISKCALPQAVILYSGHGNGFAAVGALTGEPDQFNDLTYNYRGYISTSVIEQVAVDFLTKRANKGSRPVLLELHLPANFRALDMGLIPGGGSEFEYLIGRNERFRIFGADRRQLAGVDDPVLVLMLQPKRNISEHPKPAAAGN
jgi:hypothetical protein